VLAPALVLLTEPDALVEHLLAALAAGGFFLAAVLAYPRGMGMGDVKLAFVLGLFLGRDVGAALLIALVAGTLVGAAVIARKGAAEGRKTAVPFGPFLALGAVIALFAGDAMVEWYLSTFA
jgi:leader peptidase (prepilin peptidase) / N-methyltransferase